MSNNMQPNLEKNELRIPQTLGVNIIAKGALYSFAGAITYRGINFVFQVLMARTVSEEQFGLFLFVSAFINLVALFALFGVHQGGLRYIARLRAFMNHKSEARLARQLLLIVVIVSGLVGGGIVIFANPIANLFEGNTLEISSLLRWFAPAIPFSALVLLLSSLAEGQKRVELGALSRDIIQPVTALIIAILFVVGRVGFFGFVYSFNISTLVATISGIFFLRTYFFNHQSLIDSSKEEYKLLDVIKFSLPFVPMLLVRQVGNKLEIYLLGFLSTPVDVGVFSAAASTALLVTFGLQAVWRIYAAMAAEHHAKREILQLENLLQLASRWSLLASLPALIMIIFFGNSILEIFGRNFISGYNVLLILAIGQCINAATGPVGVTLTMSGYPTLVLINSIVSLVVNVILDWWLISIFGILGAAIGSSIVLILSNLVMAIEVRSALGIRPYDSSLLRPILACGICILIIWLIQPFLISLSPLIKILTGGLVVGSAFAIFYFIFAPYEDRWLLMSFWSRIKNMIQIFYKKNMKA